MQWNNIIPFLLSIKPIFVYFFIFISSFIENIFPPFPGDTIIAISGLFVGKGIFDFYTLLIIYTCFLLLHKCVKITGTVPIYSLKTLTISVKIGLVRVPEYVKGPGSKRLARIAKENTSSSSSTKIYPTVVFTPVLERVPVFTKIFI